MLSCGLTAKLPAFMLWKQSSNQNIKEPQSVDNGTVGENKNSDDDEWTPPQEVNKNQIVTRDCKSCTCGASFTSNRIFSIHIKTCKENRIAGKHISLLTDQTMSTMGIKMGDRLDVLTAVKKTPLTTSNESASQLQDHQDQSQNSECPKSPIFNSELRVIRRPLATLQQNRGHLSFPRLPFQQPKSTCWVNQSSMAGPASASTAAQSSQHSFVKSKLSISNMITPRAEVTSQKNNHPQPSKQIFHRVRNNVEPNQLLTAGLRGATSLSSGSSCVQGTLQASNVGTQREPATATYQNNSVQSSGQIFQWANQNIGSNQLSSAGQTSSTSLFSGSSSVIQDNLQTPNVNTPSTLATATSQNESHLSSEGDGGDVFERLSNISSISEPASEQLITHTSQEASASFVQPTPTSQQASTSFVQPTPTSQQASASFVQPTPTSQQASTSFVQVEFQSTNTVQRRLVTLQDSAFELLPAETSAEYQDCLNKPERIKRLLTDAKAELIFIYDVRGIILRARKGITLIKTLDDTGFIYGRDRQIIVQALLTYIEKTVKHHSQNSTLMRESIAVCMISAWPTLSKVCFTKDDRPWFHWYNSKENTGFIAHVTATLQRNLKREGKQVRPGKKGANPAKKPRPLKALPTNDHNLEDPDPEDYANDVEEANRLPVNTTNKPTILKLMRQTHSRRREKILYKEVSPSVILLEFRHFLSFGGDVIEQEFALIYPEKTSNFTRDFVVKYMPKLLALAKKDTEKYSGCLKYGSDILNSIVILVKYLGTPRKSYLHEEKMPAHYDLKDFANLIPIGSDPNAAAVERLQAGYPIQPHLILCGDSRRTDKFFLYVSEGKILELGNRISPLKAVDLLIKSYYAFNLHFPLAWKNALRFIEVYVFKLFPQSRDTAFIEKESILRQMVI